MIMDKIIDGILNSGPIGGVLIVMLWMNYQLIKKLFKIIETNTTALTQVADTNDEVKEKLGELAKAQAKRRKDYGGTE